MSFNKLATLVACLAVTCGPYNQVDGQEVLTIPNGFKNQDGFYLFESQQSRTLKNGQSDESVTEYLSLKQGLSFSLHRYNGPNGGQYAIISDGINGRTYLVENFDRANPTCELDHVHTDRHIFPWQYDYEINANESIAKQRRKRKRKQVTDATPNTVPSSVYGVGAIWLNAIKSEATSAETDDTEWVLSRGDIEIRLGFKPAKETDKTSGNINLRLGTIEVRRSRTISPVSKTGHNLEDHLTQITITSYQGGIKDSDKRLSKFKRQLSNCRENSIQHHIFPSLLASLNESPYKAIGIKYIAQKYPLYGETVASGAYDEARKRIVHDIEYTTEWLSYLEETQTIRYEPLPVVEGEKFKADVYMSKLTGRADSTSPLCHLDYHIFEVATEIVSCKEHEFEPLPRGKQRMFAREVDFYRRDRKFALSAKIRGLSALLMNMEQAHEKTFDLTRNIVSITPNPRNLEYKENIEAIRWSMTDRRHGWVYDFYFAKSSLRVRDIAKLKLIEIRDSTVDPPRSSRRDQNGRDEDDSYNLVARYNILKIETNPTKSEVDFFFTLPDECHDDDDPADQYESDDDSDISDEDWDYRWEDMERDSDSDSEDDYEKDPDYEQQIGEKYDLNPQHLIETHDMPSFFSYQSGHDGYEITSRIGTIESSTLTEPQKYIFLKETFSSKQDLDSLKIYSSSSRLKRDDFEIEYMINYHSELIFKHLPLSYQCSLEAQPLGWLRLISTSHSYFVSDKANRVMEVSTKLRQYGIANLWRLASESQQTRFVGMKKQAVKGLDGNSYKQVIWATRAEDDHDFEFRFQFLFNLNEYHADKSKRKLKHRSAYLHLDSVSTFRHGEVEDSRLKMVELNILTWKRVVSSGSLNLSLPNYCSTAIAKATNIDKQREALYQYEQKLPSFFDYIFRANAYRIRYSITNELSDTPDVYQVEEEYDRDTHRGRIHIESNGLAEQIFIETVSKSLLSYNDTSRQCKRVTHYLNLLLKLGDEIDLSNKDFDETKLYGLAALWIEMSKIEDFELAIDPSYDHRGNKYLNYVYKSRIHPKEGTGLSDYGVWVTFSRTARTERTITSTAIKYEDDKLPVIELWPILYTLQSSISIKIILKEVLEPTNWKLPEPCLEQTIAKPELNPSTPSKSPSGDIENYPPAPRERAQFPRVVDIISWSNFHMRSEVVVLSGSSTYLYLLDEWIMRGQIRMKSRRLKFNFDLLIFVDESELFDISVPYICSKKAPQLHFMEYPAEKSNDLLSFWKSESSINVQRLSSLYYGPLTLWALATRDEANVELIHSFDTAPQPTGDKSLDELEREMRTEIWRISSPTGAEHPWSYTMEFEKVSLDKGDGSPPKVWRILNSIKIADRDHLGTTYTVSVDVVNYRYDHTDEESQAIFTLPDGYGCTRTFNPLGATDEFDANIYQVGGSIFYEASLEMLDDSNPDPELGQLTQRKQVLPSRSGKLTILSQSLINPNMDILIHHSRTRLLNGVFQATKMVYDASTSLQYLIDKITGYCTIALVKDAHWSLDFSNQEKTESVVIDESMFKTLFLDTYKGNYRVLNYSRKNGFVTSSYELQVGNIELTSSLSGPATIIRYFGPVVSGNTTFLKEENRYARYHHEMSVKVILFNAIRSKIRAIFTISAKALGSSGLDKLLLDANIVQCLNDGDQSWDRSSEAFVLEYQIHPTLQYLAMLIQNQIKTAVYRNLMEFARVLPLQLDGHIRVEMGANSMLRIHFNMLQAPTAYLHFHTIVEARMTGSLEARSELRFLGSVEECSRWCDQVSCLAMSYCSDRTCRILPDRAAADKNGKYFKLNKEQVSELESFQSDARCSYYYRLQSPPPSLAKFEELMSKTVNLERAPDKLEHLAVDLTRNHIIPNQFYSSRKKFDTLGDDIDSTRAPAQDINTYHTSRRFFKLDAAHLDNFNSKEGTKVISFHFSRPSQTGCLEECVKPRDIPCIAASFCKETSDCTIFTGKADIKKLVDATGSKAASCSVTIRDYTPLYDKIPSVSEPTSYEVKLDHYSAVECAAACKASEGYNCLSFDSCRPNMNTDDRETLGDYGETPEVRDASTCFLQRSHITQDSFDRSRTKHGESANKSTTCDHYSRAAIGDYLKISGKKLISKVNAVVRGVNADRCAVDCEEDDKCRAFEYCYNSKSKPTQSCYFVRSSDVLDTSGSSNNYERQLRDSNLCSVYILQTEVNEPIAHSILGSIEEGVSVYQKKLTMLLYILGAIVVGAIVQLIHMQLIGRPLIFSR